MTAFALVLPIFSSEKTAATQPAMEEGTSPSSPAPDLLELKAWVNAYTQWHRITDYHESATHWSRFIRVYVRKESIASIYGHNYEMQQLVLEGADEDEIEEEGGFHPYPVGTVLAKENFARQEDGEYLLESISFMKKTGQGAWYYSQMGPNAELIVDSLKSPEAAAQLCVDCHNELADQDYLFHSFYDWVPPN